MARHKEKKKISAKRNTNNSSNPARVARITNVRDAGFEGQDAFQLGDDEIRLGRALSYTHL